MCGCNLVTPRFIGGGARSSSGSLAMSAAMRRPLLPRRVTGFRSPGPFHLIQSAVALDTAAEQAHRETQILQEIPGATISVSTDRCTASSAAGLSATAPSRST